MLRTEEQPHLGALGRRLAHPRILLREVGVRCHALPRRIVHETVDDGRIGTFGEPAGDDLRAGSSAVPAGGRSALRVCRRRLAVGQQEYENERGDRPTAISRCEVVHALKL